MLIPYKFIAGSTAKANEVNANFAEVKKSVDALEQNQANTEVALDNKANINGNQEQLFNVAAGNTEFCAINLGQLLNFLTPLSGIILGMNISVHENPNVIITSGTCLDSTGRYIINGVTTPLTLTATAANTNMFIFATQSLLDDTFTYEVTDNEYTIYTGRAQRLIGSFSCDTTGQINSLSLIGTRVNPEEVINVLLG